jgi:cell division protein ZipA
MSNWLTGFLVILIIIILADGFRRTFAARRNRIRVSPTLKKRVKQPEPEIVAPAETFTSELPNGGARVIGRRDSLHTPPPSPRSPKINPREAREIRRREEAAKRTPEQTSLNLNDSVPILMESVESQSAHDENKRIEPTFSQSSGQSSVQDSRLDDQDLDEDLNSPYENYDENDDDEDDYDEDEHDEVEDYEDDDEEDEDEDLDEYDTDETDASASSTPHAEPEEVFIINVMAFKDEMFGGNDLLEAVLKSGLRFGNMDIFHKYSDAKGEGTLLFSMANMVKPGTFDLDAMDEFETPGVSLFMTLPIAADSMKSFELMVETANSLADALDGELKDEQRSAMTRQTIEHCRQRISEFERKKLFKRPRQ